MSYDLYCYKSKIGKPDESEADLVIETDTDKWAKKDTDPVGKLAVLRALINYDPKLIFSDFHYGEITELTPAIIESEKKKFDHIELTVPEGEISIRLIIYDNMLR